MQLELRRRLAQGLQFQTSYVFGNAMQSGFFSHRVPLQSFSGHRRDRATSRTSSRRMVYDLPFGQGRRFMGGAGAWMERLVGGWQVGLKTKIQSGQLVDIGNVRLVGWIARRCAEKRSSCASTMKARKSTTVPEDVIDNTIRAFSVSGRRRLATRARAGGSILRAGERARLFRGRVGSGECWNSRGDR